MKNIIIVFTLLISITYLSCILVAGTGDEVNNGDLFGQLLTDTDNTPIRDRVTVSLYWDSTEDPTSRVHHLGAQFLFDLHSLVVYIKT